nr:16S rRNA (cytosine(967)-C(5))-methyltransferase RsmB [Actinomycetota bacterium]
ARDLVAALSDEDPAGAALLHSHPEWLVRMWWEQLGPEEARALLARDNEPAEVALRVNLTRLGREEAMAELRRAGAEPRPVPDLDEGVVLGAPFDLAGSRLFREGLVTPQSRASMLVARVVDPRPGERVLDLCAAPGAKSTHLAELMRGQGRLVAVERHAGRARELAADLRRVGGDFAEVVGADARDGAPAEPFDRVLLDSPCSDLGTLQGRPDARWRKTPATLADLRSLQAELLAAAAERMRPGGTLVYSTCTISADENAEQVAALLADRPELSLDDLGAERPGLRDPRAPACLALLPHRHGTEGFFIARLRRSQAG